MTENGFYLLKNDYATMVNSLGGKYLDTKERPIYCCIPDNQIDGLYWAIPTSDISHRSPSQIAKIEKYCSLPTKDMRSCYYHIGETNRPAVFRISNTLPITDKYIDKEYISQGQQLCIQDARLRNVLRQKLLKILSYENSFPNRLEQHITDIKDYLSHELCLEHSHHKAPATRPSIHERIEAAKIQITQRDVQSTPPTPQHKKNSPER